MSEPTISASGPPVDASTYKSLVLMIALCPSDVATTNVENNNDEEILDEEMTHSFKIMYEKLVETINQIEDCSNKLLNYAKERMSLSNK